MTTRALEDQEIQAIFEHIDGCNTTRNRALLITGIGMALRASELVGLQVGDVVDGNGNVKQYVTIRGEIAKFGKEREVQVWSIVHKELSEFIAWKRARGQSIETDSPLFVSREGGHLTRQALFLLIKKIFAKAGIDQSPHALRKTGATIFYLASDSGLIETQLFLGHASPETTRRYIGIPSQKMREYTETSSDMFENAIQTGEFNAIVNMLNSSLTNLPDNDLIIELAKRGFDIQDLINQLKTEQMQPEQMHKAKIIQMRKVA